MGEVGSFKGSVELVKAGLNAIVGSVDRGHGGDVERGLEWICED